MDKTEDVIGVVDDGDTIFFFFLVVSELLL